MPSPLDDIVKKAKGEEPAAGGADAEAITAMGKKILKAFESRDAEELGMRICELVALKTGAKHEEY